MPLLLGLLTNEPALISQDIWFREPLLCEYDRNWATTTVDSDNTLYQMNCLVNH